MAPRIRSPAALRERSARPSRPARPGHRAPLTPGRRRPAGPASLPQADKSSPPPRRWHRAPRPFPPRASSSRGAGKRTPQPAAPAGSRLAARAFPAAGCRRVEVKLSSGGGSNSSAARKPVPPRFRHRIFLVSVGDCSPGSSGRILPGAKKNHRKVRCLRFSGRRFL